MDRGACWTTVHGVAKSRTRLNNWVCTGKKNTGLHLSSLGFLSCCEERPEKRNWNAKTSENDRLANVPHQQMVTWIFCVWLNYSWSWQLDFTVRKKGDNSLENREVPDKTCHWQSRACWIPASPPETAHLWVRAFKKDRNFPREHPWIFSISVLGH